MGQSMGSRIKQQLILVVAQEVLIVLILYPLPSDHSDYHHQNTLKFFQMLRSRNFDLVKTISKPRHIYCGQKQSTLIWLLGPMTGFAYLLWPKAINLDMVTGTYDRICLRNQNYVHFEMGLILFLYRMMYPSRISPEMENCFNMSPT
jgi:hypothetical protein